MPNLKTERVDITIDLIIIFIISYFNYLNIKLSIEETASLADIICKNFLPKLPILSIFLQI